MPASHATSPLEPAGSRVGAVPRLRLVALTAALLGLLAGSLAGAGAASLLSAETPSGGNASATVTRASTLSVDQSSAVVGAVQRASPAVVVIQTTQAGPFGQVGQGVGSGFIYSANGLILTNNHVVAGADSINVVLADGRSYSGSVGATDPAHDLAVVKIAATGLPVVTIGSSASLQVGQLAIAIGDPLGTYANTVTTGVISGLNRQLPTGRRQVGGGLSGLIQTDAAINPGNSGGPLLDAAGRVIGDNTAIASSAQGIGFAVPIDVARPLMTSTAG